MIWYFAKKLHQVWCTSGHVVNDEAVSHQLTITANFWIIRILSMEEFSSLMQNLMQICCSTHSTILNATAMYYISSFNCGYRPRWLVQWSHHCSHMRIPVHSPCLSGYIDVTQTILIILTMAGPFQDRPHTYTYICVYIYTCICLYVCVCVYPICSIYFG